MHRRLDERRRAAIVFALSAVAVLGTAAVPATPGPPDPNAPAMAGVTLHVSPQTPTLIQDVLVHISPDDASAMESLFGLIITTSLGPVATREGSTISIEVLDLDTGLAAPLNADGPRITAVLDLEGCLPDGCDRHVRITAAAFDPGADRSVFLQVEASGTVKSGLLTDHVRIELLPVETRSAAPSSP